MVIVVLGAAQTPLAVQRHVQGQTLTSNSLPRAYLTFDVPFHYADAGSQRFTLYGVADAVQHFFVDADPSNTIRRFYWLQFEHYLASNNDHYSYTPTHVTEIGGLSFMSDTRIYSDYGALTPTPDSDSARARGFLSAKAFRLPTAAIRARLTHLPGGHNRNEAHGYLCRSTRAQPVASRGQE